MDRRSLILSSARFGIVFCTVFGLFPFRYNETNKIFETSLFRYCYSIVFYIAFAYFYLTSGLFVIMRLNPLAMIAFVYLTMIAIAVIFIVQCWKASRIARFLNDAMSLLSQLAPIRDYAEIDRESLLMFLFKVLIVSAIAQLAVINGCRILGELVTGSVDYFVIFVISVAYFLQTIVPNMLYVTILISSFYYRRINVEIAAVMKEVAKARGSFEAIPDRLNNLARLHLKLTEVLKTGNSVFSVQLLFSTADFIAILIIEVTKLKKYAKHLSALFLQTFLVYLSFAETMQSGAEVNIGLLSSLIMYVTAIFMEVYLMCTACNDAMIHVTRSNIPFPHTVKPMNFSSKTPLTYFTECFYRNQAQSSTEK